MILSPYYKTDQVHRDSLKNFQCESLMVIFREVFADGYATRLIKGGSEPEYIPATKKGGEHHIIFTHDYFSSALHEVAHWCVAGEQRRLQHDYGYWYAPDGRDEKQQIAFEQVEVKPQAVEWLFSRACGIPFRISVDNLAAGMAASEGFKAAIVQQVHNYCLGEVNDRAKSFIAALTHYYKTSSVFDVHYYAADKL
jgi:elongation factor P hydroxylase